MKYKICIFKPIDFNLKETLVGLLKCDADNKTLLKIYLVKDCIKRFKQTIIVFGYNHEDSDGCMGEVYICELYFLEFIIKNPNIGKVLLMHELSHLLNGDNKRDMSKQNMLNIVKTS